MAIYYANMTDKQQFYEFLKLDAMIAVVLELKILDLLADDRWLTPAVVIAVGRSELWDRGKPRHLKS